MTPLKKQQRKTRKSRRAQARKRVDKRTNVDEIATKARDLGYKFRTDPEIVQKGKAKWPY